MSVEGAGGGGRDSADFNSPSGDTRSGEDVSMREALKVQGRRIDELASLVESLTRLQLQSVSE